MPQINTANEFLEVTFTPQETNIAMQLMDKHLSIMYLTNTRIAILRQLAEQEFTDPAKDGENHRARAYLKGQYDILGALIESATNPPSVIGETPSTTPV
jgi:hypothetical protein